MIVVKSLSNNMVLVLDEYGNECICQGKGIGWGKKRGDTINSDLIERRFRPENEAESTHFQQLFSEIPDEFWEIAEKVVEYGKIHYGVKVSQKVILPLCDHMAGSMERYKKGVYLENPMLWDIKRFYPKEFKIGQYALECTFASSYAGNWYVKGSTYSSHYLLWYEYGKFYLYFTVFLCRLFLYVFANLSGIYDCEENGWLSNAIYGSWCCTLLSRIG